MIPTNNLGESYGNDTELESHRQGVTLYGFACIEFPKSPLYRHGAMSSSCQGVRDEKGETMKGWHRGSPFGGRNGSVSN